MEMGWVNGSINHSIWLREGEGVERESIGKLNIAILKLHWLFHSLAVQWRYRTVLPIVIVF
ncbi:conserved hypothetical protein [Microcystis aeruginosa PCC 9807]|uniref:Uncharacterized protein n=1 Tax=Microcystis aeruginosa PCC 9807 TaxID=1160283 RepID=I4HAJ1_MICAE|nr:conserved hypothetical protein [Microcystis aeruginosa PCC 9807]